MKPIINHGIIFVVTMLVAIASNAHATRTGDDRYSPKGYVAICHQGNQTLVEPYEIHEARVTLGRTPYSPTGKTPTEIIEETAQRLTQYSALHADVLSQRTRNILDNAKFLDMVDLVPDQGEVMPPPLAAGCEVKKLFKYHPPQLPYEYVFDGGLWKSLSSFGQAVALANISFSFPCYCNSLASPWDPDRIRRFNALVFSSELPLLSARDWFPELQSFNCWSVVYKGIELQNASNVQFYDQTGSIWQAWATNGIPPDAFFKGEITVAGPIEFYPNGNVHFFRPNYGGKGIQLLGGALRLSHACEAELSENEKLTQACFHKGELMTDRYYLSVPDGGHISFHPSGFVESANAKALVEINGRIIEVSSFDSSKGTTELHFDAAGNILDGKLSSPTKFRTSDSEFILADGPFTAYPEGRLKSGLLAADARLKDCTGATHQYPAKTEIHFNEAGMPCGSEK